MTDKSTAAAAATVVVVQPLDICRGVSEVFHSPGEGKQLLNSKHKAEQRHREEFT